MILQGKKHPRTPLELEDWGQGYFKSAYSYGKNDYFSGFGNDYMHHVRGSALAWPAYVRSKRGCCITGNEKFFKGFSGFGIAPLIPVAIEAGLSIFSSIFGRHGMSAEERQRLWMEFMQRQSEAYNAKETLVYGVLPAIAIIGGILLLRKG